MSDKMKTHIDETVNGHDEMERFCDSVLRENGINPETITTDEEE